MLFPRKEKDDAAPVARKPPRITRAGSFIGFRKVHSENITVDGHEVALTVHISQPGKRAFGRLVRLALSGRDGVVRFAGGAIRIMTREVGAQNGGTQEAKKS